MKFSYPNSGSMLYNFTSIFFFVWSFLSKSLVAHLKQKLVGNEDVRLTTPLEHPTPSLKEFQSSKVPHIISDDDEARKSPIQNDDEQYFDFDAEELLVRKKEPTCVLWVFFFFSFCNFFMKWMMNCSETETTWRINQFKTPLMTPGKKKKEAINASNEDLCTVFHFSDCFCVGLGYNKWRQR